jgi:DNA-binding transcriptional MerR regulator
MDHTPPPDQPAQMRIGELARASGVRRETIHFYLREGLLPPPDKVNARVAYFDAGHLARLQLIKELQRAHLPLAVIREQLDGFHGLSPEALIDHALPKLIEFLNIDGEESELSAAAVAERAGLTEEQLVDLETLGVLRPAVVDGHRIYTQADADAALAVRTILNQGVPLAKLRFVERYAQLIEAEHGFLFHHVIRPALLAGRRDQVSATLAFRALRALEAYLRRQIRRRMGLFSEVAATTTPDPLAGESHPSDPQQAA